MTKDKFLEEEEKLRGLLNELNIRLNFDKTLRGNGLFKRKYAESYNIWSKMREDGVKLGYFLSFIPPGRSY